MTFKSSGPKTRPDRVKATHQSSDSPTNTTPSPPQWSSRPRQGSTSSQSSTASFHDARFPPDEESRMVEASNELKKSANRQFTDSDFSSAISTYDKAASELPNYLDYELAVLQSNIAACHIRLEQWKEAVDACEQALSGLERELPMPKPKKQANPEKKKQIPKTSKQERTALNSDTESDHEGSPTVVELPDTDDTAAEAAALQALNLSDQRRTDIQRIRTKTLLRRARAKSSIEPATWANLSAALEDYTLLASSQFFTGLPPSDQRTVRSALVTLPPRVNEAKEHEVGEMMGKLKDLGNGILKPFGLSTDMFKMVKDENTGGYSLSFEQGGGKK